MYIILHVLLQLLFDKYFLCEFTVFDYKFSTNMIYCVNWDYFVDINQMNDEHTSRMIKNILIT